MILLGKALLEEAPGSKIVGEVKCSQTMFDALAEAGGQVEMWKVGHSQIKARMKETGALLAGEMSGHIFIGHRWLGFDDGIYAGARLLELLSRSDRTLASFAADLPKAFNTPELRVDCSDETKFEIVKMVTERLRVHPAIKDVNTIDGVRAAFKGGGWALVRASNTQAALVVRCEAESLQQLSKIKALIGLQVSAARQVAEAGRSDAGRSLQAVDASTEVDGCIVRRLDPNDEL
jgi:phosphomannomutase/phosphoglucomutase